MEERHLFRLRPADEDPEIHHYLTGLSSFAPAQGLAERVLLRVRWPLPSWLRQVRERLDSRPIRRVMWITVASLSAGSLALTVAVVAFIANARGELAAAFNWTMSTVGAGTWGAALDAVTAASGEVSGGVSAVLPSSSGLLAAVGVTILLFTVCVWGLRRTIRVGASRSAHGA